MITDYSEVTAGMQTKFYSLKHALEDKQYMATLGILRDLQHDIDMVIKWTQNKIEEESKNGNQR